MWVNHTATRYKSCLCTLTDDLPLKLGQGSEDIEDQLFATGCGVDILSQRLKAHFPLIKACDGVNEVSENLFGKGEG
jgi:hypothetical protein